MAAALPDGWAGEIEALVRRVMREELRRAGPEVDATAPTRPTGRVYAALKRRERLRFAAGNACESCAWIPPSAGGGNSILNIHHVVPEAAGGGDDDANLAVLCPNCHAIAHRLTFVGRHGARYAGPENKPRLLGMLRLLREDPDHFYVIEHAHLERLRDAREAQPVDEPGGDEAA